MISYRHTAYLSLGSNDGNSLQILTDAISNIAATCCDVLAISAVYRTAAWGVTEQPDFFNMAISLSTNLEPEALLFTLQQIEKQHNRRRTTKWGQRTLDIDILFYDDIDLSLQDLIIPHPFLHQRAFVLVPLATIAPKYMHPVLHLTIEQLLERCNDTLEVKRIE